jgi:hypothetical protein
MIAEVAQLDAHDAPINGDPGLGVPYPSTPLGKQITPVAVYIVAYLVHAGIVVYKRYHVKLCYRQLCYRQCSSTVDLL